jgi:light-regulated signal transduction histidine kinase (bacteriophytochrome)
LRASISDSKADISFEQLPVVRIPEVHLQQLFQNLITNGIKYRSAEAPCIRITCQRQDSLWRFAFQDNGIGIPAEYHNKIFGIFKRLHGREQYQGTGIGLAICKRIVERYGGRIWVNSEPGRGSTFYFTLPAREQEAGEGQ